MKKLTLGILSGLAFASQGCSSSYQPARSPRVAMVYEGGQVAFVRDDKRYGGLFLGGGLLDAVQGNPRAEQEARKAKNLEIGGFVFALGGLASLGGAFAVQANSHPADEHQSAAVALLLSGFVAEMVGATLTLSSVPHFYDAINIYNDDVDRSLLAPPPPPPLRFTPPSFGPVSVPPAPRVQPVAPPPVPSTPPPSTSPARPTSSQSPSSAAFPLQ